MAGPANAQQSTISLSYEPLSSLTEDFVRSDECLSGQSVPILLISLGGRNSNVARALE